MDDLLNQDFLATEGFDFRNMKFHLGKIPFHPCKDYDFCCGQNMSLFLKKNYNLTGIQYFPLKKRHISYHILGRKPPRKRIPFNPDKIQRGLAKMAIFLLRITDPHLN